jgi:hypothetical protein
VNTSLSEGDVSAPRPRWLRTTAAVKYSGFSRTQIYDLIREHKIRSFSHRTHPEARGGVRFVSAESIDAYLDLCASGGRRVGEEPPGQPSSVKVAAPTKKRARTLKETR